MYKKYPHDSITVNDNTILSTNGSVNVGPIMFCPLVSDRGEDSVIKECADREQFLKEHGEPDIKKHGQAIYNAVNWLSSKKGVIKFIRVTAKNATNANFLVLLDLEVTETQKVDENNKPLYKTKDGKETTVVVSNEPIMVRKVKTKLRGEYFNKVTSISENLKAMMRTKYVSNLNDKGIGKITLPLYCIYCKGKGSYGTGYRFRLTGNTRKDRETPYRNYTFELYTNFNGLEKANVPLPVTTDPLGRDIVFRQSVAFADVVKKNVLPIVLETVDDYVLQAANIIKSATGETNYSKIDIINFVDEQGMPYKNVEVDKDSLDLSDYTGIPLQGGTDGDFELSNPDRWNAIYERYADVFKGKIDKRINNIEDSKIDYTLDAGFPLEVKKALYNWRKIRNDHPAFIDASIINTVEGLKNWKRDEIGIDDYSYYFAPHNFDTYDEFTGRIITVTETYLISKVLPEWIATHGAHVPMAGIDLPLDQYIIEGSLRPSIGSDDTDKNDLVDLRLNYIEKQNGHYVFATVMSALSKESDLVSFNNVMTLYQIKNALRELGPLFRFKFNDTPEDIKMFNRLTSQKLDAFRDAKTRKIVSDVRVDTLDERRKTLDIIAGVVFRDFNEICDITINVNRME